MSQTNLHPNTGRVSSVDDYTSDKEDAPTNKDESTLFTKGDKSRFTKEQLDEANETHSRLSGQTPGVLTGMEQRRADNSPTARQAMSGDQQLLHQNAHNQHTVDSAAQTRMASAADEPGISGIANSVTAHETQSPPKDDKAAGDKFQQGGIEQGDALTRWWDDQRRVIGPKITQCDQSLLECIKQKEEALRCLGPIDTPGKFEGAKLLQDSIDTAKGFLREVDEKSFELNQIISEAVRLKKAYELPVAQVLNSVEESVEEKLGELHDLFTRCALYGAYIEGYSIDRDVDLSDIYYEPTGDDDSTLFTKGDNSASTREKLDKANKDRPNLRGLMPDVNTDMDQYRADNSPAAAQAMLGHYQQMNQNARNRHTVDSAADESEIYGVANSDAYAKTGSPPEHDVSQQAGKTETLQYFDTLHNELNAVAVEVKQHQTSLRQIIQQKEEFLNELGRINQDRSLSTAKDFYALRKGIDTANELLDKIQDVCDDLDGMVEFILGLENKELSEDLSLSQCKESFTERLSELKALLERSSLYEAGRDGNESHDVEMLMFITELSQEALDEKCNKFIDRLNFEMDQLEGEIDRQVSRLIEDAESHQMVIDEIPNLRIETEEMRNMAELAALMEKVTSDSQAQTLIQKTYPLRSELNHQSRMMSDSVNKGRDKVEFLYEFVGESNKLLSQLNELLNLQRRPLIDIRDDFNLDWRGSIS